MGNKHLKHEGGVIKLREGGGRVRPKASHGERKVKLK
jgi:hypothetical protein